MIGTMVQCSMVNWNGRIQELQRDDTATALLGSDMLPDEIMELNTPHELFAAFLSQ
jgi:hypothetical protein